MHNILILHCYHSEFPPRSTSYDWLYSFYRYGEHRCFYLNLFYSDIPWYFTYIEWDLIIFTDLLLMERWNPAGFNKIIKKLLPLKKYNVPKAIIPQDEFIYTDILCDVINQFDINYVFSCAKESEWKKIYNKVDFKKVKFFTVLTGYLEDKRVKKIRKLSNKIINRDIDIGYRSKTISPSLGRHGVLKSDIAEIFEKQAKLKGLKSDISLRNEDIFLGDSWYQFLLRCKYIIGIEGGASILDRDGTFFKATKEYFILHLNATFEEVEANCFPNQDGYLQLFAISPRNLEACATKTCQILIEGRYNGILEPGKHYIELKKDLSNLNDVMEIVRDDKMRKAISESAYHDIVDSGLYSYRSFVKLVFDNSLNSKNKTSIHLEVWYLICYMHCLVKEKISWIRLAFSVKYWKPFKTSLPGGLKTKIKGLLKKIKCAE
ncbi:MAG: hypothetical protein ACD_79C00252G0009 [uncultured bacterium]|nr:MAG: hypothetical protein ACD_79C00252G0009 [uncultured bacterium]